MSPRPRALLALLCTLLFVSAIAPARAGATDPSMFAAGTVWTGDFADPSIVKVGSVYWAHATVTGGDNLPAAWSTDLHTWHARSAYPAGSNPGWWPGYNDALPHPASWALYDVVRNGRSFTRPWAPSVTRVGSHYVLAYSVPYLAANPNRRCISIATSASPAGPFVDTSRGPIYCSSDTNGTNDPQVFVGPRGVPWLIFKNTGVVGARPTTFWSHQLDSTGTRLLPGGPYHLLLRTAQRWEGTVIENPALVYYGGRFLLFYSANGYNTAAYAIGYAECSAPWGPCTRRTTTPLLATTGPIAGPGGPAPVVGPDGALRLGYAAWDAGHVGYQDPANHRRLHVARLWVGGAGLVHVSALG